jgi:hypothetical protein
MKQTKREINKRRAENIEENQYTTVVAWWLKT